MRVAINLVKDGDGAGVRLRRQHGRADGDFALRAEDACRASTVRRSRRNCRRAPATTTALDLGANVNCTPEQLVQFAVMGSALVSAIDGIERPSVGLLNIGEEDIKGNDVVKETGELLKASGLNFYGNVEGDDIYKGTTTSWSATASSATSRLRPPKASRRMLADFLREEFTRNALRKTLAVFALPMLNAFGAASIRAATTARR